ncbi:MAG: RDD family protein [Solirubrobacteraceae bacterium]
MSSGAGSLESESTVQTVPEEDARFVGIVTRAVSWLLDAIAINVVAIATGLGAELVLSIFPVSRDLASVLKPIAGVAYIVWTGLYFVVFWSWTGQTLGARTMQIQLVSANGGRVKPARAVVRWVGMNLAMVPLFAGFAPILFKRRGFPDWLAHTAVISAPQLSMAQAGRAALRTAREDQRRRPPAIAPGSEEDASASGDGAGSRGGTRDGRGYTPGS